MRERSAPGVPERREARAAFRRGEIDVGRFGVYGTRDWGPAEVRGKAVKDPAPLNDRYGTRGMARGAVVLRRRGQRAQPGRPGRPLAALS